MTFARNVRFVGGTSRSTEYGGVKSLGMAITICEQRAKDMEYLVGWPALADSWRREAEKLRAQLPVKERK